MKILIAASEAVPYVKTGGLADVTGALLEELRGLKQDVSLILPLYSSIKDNFKLYNTGKSVNITMGQLTKSAGIWTSDDSPAPKSYFVDCADLYDRPELYGTAQGEYPDNALRFSFFPRAVLETCIAMKLKPDVIHCNDWQTGLLPLYLRTFYSKNRYLMKTATLFTIHNLGYQGIFESADMKYTGMGWNYFTPEGIEFYGKLNYMKAGLIYSDLLTAVSNTYANEILDPENGFGLDGVLRNRKNDLFGVINGIDYDKWDPMKDDLIPAKYGPENLRFKAKCKKILVDRTGIDDAGLPLFGIVSRLSSQKGLDLIFRSLDELLGMKANIIVLGKGEEYYESLFRTAAGKFRGRLFVKTGFDEALSHLVYSGCDFFLMPSKYEPCGLGQLISMKYGTIPVARKTGGLADTIQDYNHRLSTGTGFLFSDFTPEALQDSVKRAINVFNDRKRMKKLIHDAMASDFSWRKSAVRYLELYKKAMGEVKR